MATPVRQIPRQYTHAGVVFTMVKRTATAAMYQGLFDGMDVEREVHKVRIRKPRVIMGVQYPEMEILASTKEFGLYGWAISDRQRSENKYNQLCEQ